MRLTNKTCIVVVCYALATSQLPISRAGCMVASLEGRNEAWPFSITVRLLIGNSALASNHQDNAPNLIRSEDEEKQLHEKLWSNADEYFTGKSAGSLPRETGNHRMKHFLLTCTPGRWSRGDWVWSFHLCVNEMLDNNPLPACALQSTLTKSSNKHDHP